MGKFMGGCEVCHRFVCVYAIFQKNGKNVQNKLYRTQLTYNILARNKLLEKALTGR